LIEVNAKEIAGQVVQKSDFQISKSDRLAGAGSL
jgi:hypothetical protein